MGCAMSEEHTTAAVQRYLDKLAEDFYRRAFERVLLTISPRSPNPRSDFPRP